MVGADSSLDLDMLARNVAAACAQCLVAWVEERGGVLTPDGLDEALVQLLDAAPDANPMIDVGAWRLTRYRQRLSDSSVHHPTRRLPLNSRPSSSPWTSPIGAAGCALIPIANGGLRQVALTSNPDLRPRQNGESTAANSVNKTLKNLLQSRHAALPAQAPAADLSEATPTARRAPASTPSCWPLEPDVGYVPVWLPTTAIDLASSSTASGRRQKRPKVCCKGDRLTKSRAHSLTRARPSDHETRQWSPAGRRCDTQPARASGNTPKPAPPPPIGIAPRSWARAGVAAACRRAAARRAR